MLRMLAFLVKQPHLTTDEFIDYYENKHIPLIIALSGDTLPSPYKRRYLRKDADSVSGAAGAPGVDFDAVTELAFADAEARAAWFAQLSRNGGLARVAEDEERFLVRERTVAYVVEEHSTGV
ncbi:hypothetical protein FH972_021012 [Carpinus fangiana]|uniref:EthD domain-containing protein n=1 Tax=Carpinus fangiana TaxID=176857 RepID=A0A5N6KN37_9ROSI|nr:hypothetical protein FH972_021012 [Carpinus fangiana]